MRFLADECLSRRIVEALRKNDHDVLWIGDIRPGEADEAVLERSAVESRILVTEDWDYGELVMRFRKPALGVVIVAVEGSPEEVAGSVAAEIDRFGEGLIGRLTILETGRRRQRELAYLDRH